MVDTNQYPQQNSGTNHSNDAQSRNHPNSNIGQFKTIEKLGEFPIVNSAFSLSSCIYNRVKFANPFLNNAFNTMETTVQRAAYSAPAVARAPLDMIDPIICRGLNKLEQKVPVVKQEPHVLLAEAKNFIASKVVQVSQTVQNVNVRSLKDLAKEKANEVLNSRYGNIAFEGFSNSTYLAEQFIDHYLPLATENSPNSTDYQEVSALTTDQDKILFTIQTIGRIAGKLKRGVKTGVVLLNRQALDYLNNSSFMINLASYLRLVNQHMAAQQRSNPLEQQTN